MIERILFIDAEDSKYADGIQMQWGHHPLGLLYLASTVKKSYPSIKIQVFHTLTSQNVLSDVTNIMMKFKPELIGIRALNRFENQMKEIIQHIKIIDPAIFIIAGGPYPSTSYKDLLENYNVDIVVMGEGEVTLVEIINYWQNKKDIPKNILGTAIIDGDSVKVNNTRPFLDVNAIPYPDYSLIDLNIYAHVYNQAFLPSNDCAYIFSSRGCLYQCYYCHNLFGKQVRRRSAENIAGEMRAHIEDRGITKFVFVDDIFNVPPEDGKVVLRYLLREFKQHNIKLYFPNGLRADCIDDEFIELLRATNTQQISLAVETASPRLQKMIHKNLDLTKAKQSIETISKEIISTVLYMVGFPTETYEEAHKTISFAEELTYVSQPVLSVLRVYPNTPIYNLLNVSEAQAEELKLQATMELSPKIFSESNSTEKPTFYGDIFSDDLVPLKTEDIKKIEYTWLKKVIYNKERMRNSNKVISRYRSNNDLIDYYKLLFRNPLFNRDDLNRMIDFN